MLHKFLFLLVTLWTGLLLTAYLQVPEQNLQIHYLSVGQGDATLIEGPDGQKILLDGGPFSNILPELGKLMPYYDKKIDLIILTHPHADHIDGLVEILKRYEVKNILLNPVFYKSSTYLEFLETIKGQDLNFIPATNKYGLEIGDSLFFEILFPFADTSFMEFKNINNSSMVIRLKYGENIFLFTGDAEEEVEELLLRSEQDLSATYFQAGHHGSKTANTLYLLEKVNPKLVIISSGTDNKFGHPHQETLDRLNSWEIAYLDLKETGTFSLVCDLRECM
ncbi:MAG: MBL fold metallo-hydrolase [Candidatus Gracilibacteria bacterium]|nr:MBL fold metallo-hydrolase [Candidatus Gracilibacteria bacterium]